MKPIDPRLLRLSAPARTWIAYSGLFTAAGTITTIIIGVLIGHMTAALAGGETALTPAGHAPGKLVRIVPETWQWVALAAAITARALIVWGQRRLGKTAAARVIGDLRTRLLRSAATTDPRSLDRGYTHTVLTTGLGGLEAYLTGFLPALGATMIAMPAAVIVVFILDPPSGLVALVTLPLIPLFMWLVGTLTEGRTAQRLRDLSVLSEQMMDLIAGLSTLRAYRRTGSPAKDIERLGRAHHTSTMRVLRIAFLSGFVLEFLSTLSVAVVAVGIGVRLLSGSLSLAAGLMVLIIIPEVYNPLREVGARFHEAQDGLGAMAEVLDKLEGEPTGSAPPVRETPPLARPADPTAAVTVEFESLSAHGRDGVRPHNLSGRAHPGELTVLHGENGTGKSTALLALLGIATDGVTGTARVTDAATGAPLSGEDLWQRTSFLPQRPVLNPAHIGDFSGLSLGQRQRVAIARELENFRSLVLLDEPTAHLDSDNASRIIEILTATAAAGATVLVASHDPLVLAAADTVIEVTGS